MVKPCWTLDHNSVLSGLVTTEDFDKAKTVILWNDVNPIERGIINLAKSRGKKNLVYQHGRRGTSKYYPPFNEKIQADKLLVWGESDRNALLEAGQDGKKIKVVGATIFSHLKAKTSHQGINIVFCPEHWDKPVEENIMVRNKLRKLRGIRIITKIIETHNEKDFDNPIKTHRDNNNHLSECIRVLTTADLVVGISESTFELLAQAMDIPVVIMDEWKPKSFGGDGRYTEYRRIISRASKRTSLKNLNKTILQQLANPDEFKEERRQVVIEEGGLGLDTIKLIEKQC